MKTLLSMFGYAIVACVFFFAYFISPRLYVVMAIGIVVYALRTLFVKVYAGYVRLMGIKFRVLMKKFRILLPLPHLRMHVGIGR